MLRYGGAAEMLRSRTVRQVVVARRFRLLQVDTSQGRRGIHSPRRFFWASRGLTYRRAPVVHQGRKKGTAACIE